MSNSPRLVVAHEDQLAREIVAAACSRCGVRVVAEVTSYEEAARAATLHHADVILAVDRLGDELVEDALDPMIGTGARTLVLSEDLSPDRLSRVLLQDVAGYLSPDLSPDELAAGILAVARGEDVLMPEVVSVLLAQWRRLRAQPVSFGPRRRPTLTPRELDILAAMTDGLAAKAIAAQLGVAIKTVENHKIRIFDKLGVRSHAHAVTVAIAYGLAPATDAWH